MSTFFFSGMLRGGILAGSACTLALAAAAQTAPPDFSSNQVGWIGLGDIVAAPGSPPIVGQDPAHIYVPNNVGRQPTYRIGDASNPNLKPWVKDQMKRDNDEVLAGKIAYTARSSCRPGGVPGFALFGVRPVYFLQTPTEVVISYSGDAQVRHVYLDVPHSEHPAPSWYGESIGHYEGDTLVVDTVGINDRTLVDGFGTPHTKQLHVIERFHLLEDGKVLEANVHVEDPGAFTMPWNAIQRFRQYEAAVRKMPVERLVQLASAPEGPLPEEICADNPNSVIAGTSASALPIPQAVVPDF
jgi:hypothetical protein